MMTTQPQVEALALERFRRVGLNGVLAGLSSVTLHQLRQGPMRLIRRGWRWVPSDRPGQHHYAVGSPPELGQVLVVDLLQRSVRLLTFVQGPLQELRAPLSQSHQWRHARPGGALNR